MKPRTPRSPPATPTMILSLRTSGACVIENLSTALRRFVFQRILPVLASIASRCASMVPMKSVSPRMANPRLTRPQHGPASGRGLVLERPERPAGDGVERDDLIGALHRRALQRVEHAVHRQRGRLELLQRPGLPDPLQLEVLHVGRRDLRQLAVPLVEDRSRVAQPVLWFLVGAKQAIERDLLRRTSSRNHEVAPTEAQSAKATKRRRPIAPSSCSRARSSWFSHGVTLTFNDTR